MLITILKNGTIINEGNSFIGSLIIEGSTIKKVITGSFTEKYIIKHYVSNDITADSLLVIDCNGLLIIPGVIDDQVHFREPGATYKGCIESESKAAILGGVTSYMDMPNNNPTTTNISLLEKKYEIASNSSYANYSFYIGAENENLSELTSIDRNNTCGIKVFMGSSTGNMLVDNPESLVQIFKNSKTTVATHCEEESIIKNNIESAKLKYGEDIPFSIHNLIRSREACIASTKKALNLAIQFNTKLHILHISTKEEVELIKKAKEINPKISSETCVHYLYLNSGDYEIFGGKIKCNPSIKEESDRLALINGVIDGTINIVATDHAPHTKEEKENKYLKCPSGLPLVQHSLQIMIELCKNGYFSLPEIVKFMCHNPAEIFKIQNRGFLREGYYADITIIDINKIDKISTKNPSYFCGWSPFENINFSSSIIHTFINGVAVVENGKLTGKRCSMRLKFDYE